ncbi:hypothetical protein KCU93_g4320, partial [Aureobasidium melanogenum]
MLTATRLSIKPYFYPLGNTPATHLLRNHLPSVEPVEILAIGCGDVRNILFTIWSEQRRACKFNFTACDYDAAVLARNVFLLTAVTRNPSSKDIERLWRTYYHFYVTSTDLLWIQEHCKKLLAASDSISTWNDSPFGSSLKFSTQTSLSEVRHFWNLYAQARTEEEDFEVRQAIMSVHDSNVQAMVTSGERYAGAHGVSACGIIRDAFNAFWRTGVVAGNDQDTSILREDDGGRVNPLMSVSQSDKFDVHRTSDPLVGFHLAEVFDVPQPAGAALNSLARLAKSQFSEWLNTFASSIASSSVNIMNHCGDAVNFSYALRSIQGCTTIPSYTYFYNKPYSAVPLDPPSSVVTSYDVIDTSNVMDHIGLLALLPAVVPLLSERPGSVLYTDNLVQGSEKSERLLETLLHSNVTMSSLLLGVAPTGYLLGSMTDSTLVEQFHDMVPSSNQKQYRVRVSWQRAAQGDSMVPTVKSASYHLNMDPRELASYFMQTYLAMFRETEDLSIWSEVLTRKKTRPLAGDVDYYSRLTLVTLIASAKRIISTDWQECVGALVQMMKDDTSLCWGSKRLQELYMHLHLSGLWHIPALEEGPLRAKCGDLTRPSSESGDTGVLGKHILPGTVHVALIVPRSDLTCLTVHPVDVVGTPGVHLWLRNKVFEASFFAIDVFFGHFESDDLEVARVVEDAHGWSGTSDLIVTCKMPTWGLLVGPRQDVHIELDINTSRPVLGRIAEPGTRARHYTATLESENVRILATPPSTKPDAVFDTYSTANSEPPGSTSASVALNPDGTVQSIGVTNNFADDSEESRALKNGGMVTVSQISPCVLAACIGNLKHESKFFFPFPINGAAYKMKIARQSSWIEIRAPTSNALQPSGYDLDPFPIISQGTGFLAWDFNRVDPDLQPQIDTSASNCAFLQPLWATSLSRRELAQVNATQVTSSMPPMAQLKEVIRQWFLAYAGVSGNANGQDIRLFTLMRDVRSNKIIPEWMVVAKALRHDRDTGSVFMDAFFVPSTPEVIKLNPYKNVVNGKLVGNTAVIIASKEAMELWQRLVPALAERCRSWEHTSDCKYRVKSDKTSFCGCGQGQDAAIMPEPYKKIARFATRIAIPIIFAVPYVEAVGGQEVMIELATALQQHLKTSQHQGATDAMLSAALKTGQDLKQKTTDNASCDNCGVNKPGLKMCGRCEKVKYCNHACQKAAWKTHKKVCKR